eukprot:CAMPEP_0184696518 /NCGR_PEP_ID=MMETSP0313-20130426/3777_1 /TAXON_ID=2792 /ORGANISM="Porphyridium aerugineum, Strain SAG 1380-2" /LENGTH=291 /DNA_ID=CAMNT_0027155149 /DNA_START=42 /DNA_END=917 /DNA_ORIENTATION=-
MEAFIGYVLPCGMSNHAATGTRTVSPTESAFLGHDIIQTQPHSLHRIQPTTTARASLASSFDRDNRKQSTHSKNSKHSLHSKPSRPGRLDKFVPLHSELNVNVPRSKDYTLAPGEIAVRFINTPGGQDVVAACNPGDNLMAVGDSVGIRIPRSCQTGLCGACTSDLEDPSWPDGKSLIRACCTDCMVPEGCEEMVIDVYRIKQGGGKKRDPFERFNQMDAGYVAGASPNPIGSRVRSVPCQDCQGRGVVRCPECDGKGISAIEPDDDCIYCMGRKLVRCATCQGMGETRSA